MIACLNIPKLAGIAELRRKQCARRKSCRGVDNVRTRRFLCGSGKLLKRMVIVWVHIFFGFIAFTRLSLSVTDSAMGQNYLAGI